VSPGLPLRPGEPGGWEIITIDIQRDEPLTHSQEYHRSAVLRMAADNGPKKIEKYVLLRIDILVVVW